MSARKYADDYTELLHLRIRLDDEQKDASRLRKRSDTFENVLWAISKERPVQDKAAAAFYRVRQKAKDALTATKEEGQ